MKRPFPLPALLLLPLAVLSLAGDADVRVTDAAIPGPTAAVAPTAEVQAVLVRQALDPAAPTQLDVIDDALWERFAGHNGPQWWLQPKVIRDRQGHTQLDNAQYIVRRFRDAGLPDSLALAAVTNALMESSLLSDRIQEDSKATGLFQCWRNLRVTQNLPRGGAGNGTPGFDWGNGHGVDATTAQMLDRDLNTDRILFELLHVENTTGKEFFGVPAGESFGGPLLERAAEGASVAELAALWGQRIERYRPSPGGSYAFRGKVAAKLFGAEIAYADTSSWRQNALPEPVECPPPSAFDGRGMEHRPVPPRGGWIDDWAGSDASAFGVLDDWWVDIEGCP